MADVALFETDVALEMDEAAETSRYSSNIDESEGEMKVFVQQHLLSMMHPVNLTIQDLQEQVYTLRRNVLEKLVSSNGKFEQLERHERLLQSLSEQAASSEEKSARMHSDVSQMAELVAKAARERAENACAELREQLQNVEGRTVVLEVAREARDTEWGQLQRAVGDVTALSQRTADDVNALQQAFENLNHEHLGLSQRLEVAKAKLDDTSRELEKMTSTTTHHIEEAKLASANAKKMLQSHSERMIVACMNIETYDARLKKAEVDMQKLWKEVGAVEQNLEHLHEEESRVAAEMAELHKLDARSAIQELFKGIKKLEGQFGEINEEWRPTVQAELGKLEDGIAGNRRSIASSESDIRNLDDYTNRLDGRCQDIEDQLLGYNDRQNDLLERSCTADLGNTALNKALKATDSRVDEQVRELEKITSRVYWCEKGIDNNVSNLSNLSTGLDATNAKIARDNNRLNLAHGLLKGMTKGISEAQKRAADGLDGMVPKHEEVALPGLPGTPRRPATSSGASRGTSNAEGTMHGVIPKRPASSLA